MSAVPRVWEQVRPASALRGAGVALACLSPRLPSRAGLVAASYVASWPLGKPGIQLAVVLPDEDADAWKRVLYPLASAGASWTAVVVGLAAVVRRSRVPAPVAGVLLGVAVAVGDTRMIEFGERVKAKRAAAAAERETD